MRTHACGRFIFYFYWLCLCVCVISFLWGVAGWGGFRLVGGFVFSRGAVAGNFLYHKHVCAPKYKRPKSPKTNTLKHCS